MITAEQARQTQAEKQAIIQAAEQSKKHQEAIKAELDRAELAQKNKVDSQIIFEKAQQSIQHCSSEGMSEASFYPGTYDDGAFEIAFKMLGELGFEASRVIKRISVPVRDNDMQGIYDYDEYTGEVKVKW